jgi:hypothetical protein
MDRGTMSASASSVVRSIITAVVMVMTITMDKRQHSRTRTTVADDRRARVYKASEKKKRLRWHEVKAR